MNNLAPIGLSTYSRINHLKQTIQALQKNTLAKYSELYIFSDAPQKHDEKLVTNIREYIHSIDGFKKIYIVERVVNGRVKNNRDGMIQLLNCYGKIIWLEDDIVTAPGFLKFMNEALEFYKDNDKILSITGYCPTFKMPKEYKKDVFVLQRFCAWGFATWKHCFNPYDYELSKHGIDEFLINKKKVKEFKNNGEDMYPLLLSEYSGSLDALDVKLMYYEYKYNLFTIYPSKSLVQNIGHDGSGIHCRCSDKFTHKKLWDKVNNFKYIKDIQVNKKIRKSHCNFRRLGFKDKAIIFTKEIGVHPLLKKIMGEF